VQQPYDASAQEVWTILRDFGGVGAWMPGIDSCEVEGEGIGAVRDVAMGGIVVKERLEAYDEQQRSFGYCIFEGPIPFKKELSSVAVREAEGGGCVVEWSAEFELQDGVPDDVIETALKGAYGGALEALKAKLDG